MSANAVLPRLLRMKDVLIYLGMNRALFNKEVRPYISSMRLGTQIVSFDRLDLDAWVEHYKRSNGCPARRRSVWDKEKCQDFPKEMKSGTLTKKSTECEFMKALELVGLKKRKNT
ncbi:MAG TPA: hypothetical protein PLV31_04805 [Gammaproteobacteria bacterium]|nr:hypothetical protein [Gammaproteobacteria bacterium]